MNTTNAQGMNELKGIAREAMRDYGLQPEFPAEALAQLKTLTRGATDSSAPIRDLRSLLWASIDNDDSRDLDQLSVAEALAGGSVKILVAIADVDSLIAADTPIDHHAEVNTTSVYTAAQIFPMLPELLSTDLTSLAEGQERKSVVVEMTFDASGTLTSSDIYRATVLNRAKLAYDSLAAWLEGTAPAPPKLTAVAGMDAQIRLQDQVAQSLKRVRAERGALMLDTIGAQPVLSDGVLADLRPDEKNRAKELIEHFMIAANGVGAQYLEQRGLPSLRRVLRKPERWGRIVALAAQFSGRLPAEPDSHALNEFLIARREADPTHFPDLSLSIIKLLGAGVYACKLPGQDMEGHFGLAVHDYMHSTAPNRRFADLITQRLLKAALAGAASPYDSARLAALADHCNTQQSNADKVERRVRKSAAAMLLASQTGKTFDAIVTGSSPKGTWIRIARPVAEGRVIRGAEGLDVGDRIKAKLIHTDPARGFIDFEAIR